MGDATMKTIALSDETYKKLILMKYENNYKNLDEVINHLISQSQKNARR